MTPDIDIALEELRQRLDLVESGLTPYSCSFDEYKRLAGDWLLLSAAISHGEQLKQRKAA